MERYGVPALVIGIAPITAKALNIPTQVTEEEKYLQEIL